MSPSAPPSPSQTLARLLGGGRGVPPLGVGVLAVLGFTLLVVILSIWPLVRVRNQVSKPIPQAPSDEPLFKDFHAAVGGDLAQVEGRSLFAVPAPPAHVEVAEKPETAKATRYGGPSVIAMINGKVWFSDGQRLGVGEAGTDSLKVLSLDAPWSTKVRWQGGEFDVEFFQRSPLLTGEPIADASDDRAPYVPPALRRRGGARGSRSTISSAGPPPSAPSGARTQATRSGPSAGGDQHTPDPGTDTTPPPPMQDPPSDEPPPPHDPGAQPGGSPDDPHPAAPPNAEPGSAPGADPSSDPRPDPQPAPPPSPEPEPENAHK